MIPKPPRSNSEKTEKPDKGKTAIELELEKIKKIEDNGFEYLSELVAIAATRYKNDPSQKLPDIKYLDDVLSRKPSINTMSVKDQLRSELINKLFSSSEPLLTDNNIKRAILRALDVPENTIDQIISN